MRRRARQREDIRPALEKAGRSPSFLIDLGPEAIRRRAPSCPAEKARTRVLLLLVLSAGALKDDAMPRPAPSKAASSEREAALRPASVGRGREALEWPLFRRPGGGLGGGGKRGDGNPGALRSGRAPGEGKEGKVPALSAALKPPSGRGARMVARGAREPSPTPPPWWVGG